MVTDATLDQYARVLGVRLESMLLETDHTARVISESTYYSHKARLRRRINAVAPVPDAPPTVWKDGHPIVLPPDVSDA